MGTVVVTRNYQITLSKDIREEIGIGVGERMKGKVENDRIILEKVRKSPVEAATGIWKNKIKDSADYVDGLRKDWRR